MLTGSCKVEDLPCQEGERKRQCLSLSGSEAIFCGRSRDLRTYVLEEALTRGWSNGELMRAAQRDGIQAMGGTNRSRGEVFWDLRCSADLPVAELLATCAMRLGAVRFAVLQRNVNHGFTIAVTTQDHLVLLS